MHLSTDKWTLSVDTTIPAHFSTQMGRKILDARDWVAVWCRCVAESAVITARAPPTTRIQEDVEG